jgi:hypothetical protein
MNIEKITVGKVDVAVIDSPDKLITDVSSALNLMATVSYETGCSNLAINKEVIADGFFILSTKLAGEILQKFVNYRFRLAIWGDFSKYTSKPLRDFIYESNNGNDVIFVGSRDEAVARLTGVKR